MIDKGSIKNIIETYKTTQKEHKEMAEQATDNCAKTYLTTIADTLGDVIEDLEALLGD
ncbi:hypothetical protein [Wohlfahrtiimonas sp. G9077]|uniref:hypothetical protein n=1 Tax=Wohlfahrtiimonas sp. G9077 TaxID=1980118 RepID=UPI001314BDF9|nr:hypothetical protein [Wohlfahrtiimonas sp. G9077]